MRFRNTPLSTLKRALLAAAILAPIPGAAETPRLIGHSLQSYLEHALVAFAENDFARAAEIFQSLEKNFGSEPEYGEPGLQRRLLPLKGHAELGAGLPTAAVATLQRFIDSFPGDSRRPEALSSLAAALHADGRTREAVDRLAEFLEAYGHRPESSLVSLQQAEMLFSIGRDSEGIAILDEFSTGKAPAIFRHQARLRAARRMIEINRVDIAKRLLLDYRWEVGSVPEVATLCFTALELGDFLVEAGDPCAALRAYRLVLPRARLKELQERHIAEISASLERIGSGANRFWSDYYGRVLESIRVHAGFLNEGEDYTPSLWLRRGQAMLLADRFHEAWLLFERLTLDESVPGPVREEAHYRWILAAAGLELWEESLTIARTFIARYPGADLSPHAIFLIAQAHQEQRRYPEAASILAELLETFPDHPFAQRWHFTYAYMLALQEKFPEARAGFRRTAEDYPEGQLTANAELWHALTYFFERDYRSALERFDELAIRRAGHQIEGEILYRRASALYAMREYESAEKAAAGFVERFVLHQRHPEALVLLGDILMGAGKLAEAMRSFERLQPEAGHIYLYGLFQRGKILRAWQDHAGMIELFSGYVGRTDIERKARLSEALYWIGWAHAQSDQQDKAAPIFLTALERHGNDPEAAGIDSMLAMLERMKPAAGLIYPDFASWLLAERRRALSDRKPTYFSRLTLHMSQMKRRHNRPHQADSLLFEIANQVEAQEMGPEALGAVGHMLAVKEIDRSGELFIALLKDYPGAPERALAYHGLGLREYRSGNYDEALSWFRRFENETPGHHLSAEVFHLVGECLLGIGEPGEAADKFEEILRLRGFRGRPHALALIGLGRSMEAKEEPHRAIAYYQRVYTMHRAQSDLAAKGYFRSALLFERLGDELAAHRTLKEMLSMEDLSDSPYVEPARQRKAELAPRAIQTQAHPEEQTHAD